jgi:hypothetical protein
VTRPRIDFVGIGAQRCGTSWIYACLYEHPQICAPVKELHFFSREHNFARGPDWYLGHFDRCAPGSVRGEFSTSYLYAPEAAGRIRELLPEARILASLRNPVTRAFSQYRNAILAGEIGKDASFAGYVRDDPSVVGQGLYADQVERYLREFGRDRVLVLVLEDAERDRPAFVGRVYEFLGVDPAFRPETLDRAVNATRTPRSVGLDRAMVRVGNTLRRAGLDRLVWRVKRTGLPDLVRGANTETDARSLEEDERERLRGLFRPDAERLSELLDRDLAALWGLRA